MFQNVFGRTELLSKGDGGTELLSKGDGVVYSAIGCLFCSGSPWRRGYILPQVTGGRLETLEIQ